MTASVPDPKDWTYHLVGDVQCTQTSIDRFMQYAIRSNLKEKVIGCERCVNESLQDMGVRAN